MLRSQGRTSHIGSLSAHPAQTSPTSTRARRGWLAAGALTASLALIGTAAVPATALPAASTTASSASLLSTQGVLAQGKASTATPQHNASWDLGSFYEEQQLATNGQGGFPNYRIPALAVAPNGDLLASYDGRPTGGDAPGPNSLLQRRSTDGGKTWGEQTVVAAGRTGADKMGYSDPSYIVDRVTGEIFNFSVLSYDQGFFGSAAGTDAGARNVLHAAVSRSSDNGKTWTQHNITPAITPDAKWISRFAASGQGIQLRYGPHAGRLIQQYTIRTSAGALQAVSVYSDDHGATWQAGTPVGTGMDENKTVELSDGTIMLNSRDSAGSKARKVAYSRDGGVTYGEVTLDRQLPDPTNNASILRAFPDAPQGSAEAKVLLFSNAASTSSRSNGTVRLSYDDGKTWSAAKVFQTGGMAYSTLATLPDGSIGLLYEPDSGNGGIRFARFSLAWLQGVPVTITAAPAAVVPGKKTKLSVTVTNVSTRAVTGAEIELKAAPGWKVDDHGLGKLKAGESKTVRLDVTPARDVHPGTYTGQIVVATKDRSTSSDVSFTVAPRADELVTIAGQATVEGRVSVGDKIPVTYRVSNLSGATLALVPTGNLSGFSRPSAPNCGYSALAAGASYTCTTAFHTVSAEDLKAGGFTPQTTWELRIGGYSGALLITLERNGSWVPLKPARG